MAFTEDLTQFFRISDFAETLTSGSASVTGILNDAYVEFGNTQGTRPVFLCSTTDAATLTIDAACAISGISYTLRVKKPQDDGKLTLLILEDV